VILKLIELSGTEVVYSLMIANLTQYLETIDQDHNQTVDPAILEAPIPVNDSESSPSNRND